MLSLFSVAALNLSARRPRIKTAAINEQDIQPQHCNLTIYILEL
jgi:hypothetical protein